MKINLDEVYWNSNHTEYAVLISPGYGAGWATWNSSENHRIAWDKRIVEFYVNCRGPNSRAWHNACFDCDDNESKHDPLKEHTEFCEILKICGIDPKRVYFGGANDLEIAWVKPGELWQIDEYDGAESIVIFNDTAWLEV